MATLNIVERYEEEKERLETQTISALIFETTNRCKACACPGCYMVVSGRNRGPLQQFDLQTAKKVIDLVKAHNDGIEAKSLDLIGGEPMETDCWPVTQAVIEECLRRGITAWLFTNGVFMTREKAGWLLSREVPVTMKLNIGGLSDPEQLQLQAEMIGKDLTTAQRLVAGLYAALEAGYKASLLSVENLLRGGKKSNIPYVPQYYELGLELGFKPDLELMGNGEPANWGYFDLAPTISQLRWLMTQIGEIHQKKELATPQFLMPHLLGSCPFYDTALYFCADGRIQPCSNNRTVLASFNTDEDPIGTAIRNPVIQARRTLCQEKMQGPCRHCSLWSKCRGGCRATAESFGSPYLSYPLCPIQTEFDDPRTILTAR